MLIRILIVLSLGLIVPILFFVALMAGVALAASEQPDLPCVPLKDGLAGLKKAAKEAHGEVFIIQDAPHIAAFMDVLNAEEPKTSYTADAVVGFASKPDEERTAVMVGLYKQADATLCGPLGLGNAAAERALKAGNVYGERS